MLHIYINFNTIKKEKGKRDAVDAAFWKGYGLWRIDGGGLWVVDELG